MNEWDEQERRRREKEQLEASLYRNRSRLHGSGLTEDEQEERDFRRQFPQFNQVNSHRQCTSFSRSVFSLLMINIVGLRCSYNSFCCHCTTTNTVLL